MRPGIFFDTFLESFRNKMFLVFFVVSSFVIGSIGLALNMDAVNGVMRGVAAKMTEREIRALAEYASGLR